MAWFLTVLFVVTALYGLVRVVVAHSVIDRLSNAAHALMSLTMAAMSWQWGMEIPSTLQIVVFGAIALGYLGLSVSRPREAAGPGDGHHSGAGLLLYHAFMMGAMIYMAVVMGRSMSTDMAGMPMDGMGMSGHDHGSTTPLSGLVMTMSTMTTGPDVGISIAVGIVFAIAVLFFAYRAVREILRPRRPGRERKISIADPVSSALMAGGMALYFIL